MFSAFLVSTLGHRLSTVANLSVYRSWISGRAVKGFGSFWLSIFDYIKCSILSKAEYYVFFIWKMWPTCFISAIFNWNVVAGVLRLLCGTEFWSFLFAAFFVPWHFFVILIDFIITLFVERHIFHWLRWWRAICIWFIICERNIWQFNQNEGKEL